MNKNQTSNRGYRKPSRNKTSPAIENIKNEIRACTSLKGYFTEERIYLPEKGVAYICAVETTENIKTTQLRKFLSIIQGCRGKAVQDAKNILYSALCQAAYSVGREVFPRNLYEIMEECIKPEKLKDQADIDSFVKFFEAVVAYRKYMEKR